MGGSSPQTTTQQTKVDLAPEQRELLNLAMPSLREFAASPPQLPSYSSVAGFDPLQTAGQEAVLGAGQGYSGALTAAQNAVTGTAAPLSNLATQAGDVYRRLTSPDLLSPDTNPFLRQHADAAVASATDPIWRNLTEQALPAIRSGAGPAGANQYGGSRQGIAEGMAIQGASRAAGDTARNITTSLYDSAYGKGLDTIARGAALAPSVAGLISNPAEAYRSAAELSAGQLTPALWTSGVGDIRQGLAQALLGEQYGKDLYSEQLPLMVGKELASLVQAVPTAGVTTVGQVPQKSAFSSTLGGALSGASLGSMLPFGPFGTMGGALLGGLGGYFGR